MILTHYSLNALLMGGHESSQLMIMTLSKILYFQAVYLIVI